jgi:ubiquinone/menaquinone biosynthesis C-methylase UbiE
VSLSPITSRVASKRIHIACVCASAGLVALLLLYGLVLIKPGRVSADTASEVDRLAALMAWKDGTVVADIGAGDGTFSFAAARHVGPSGKVIATEIDRNKLADLRTEIREQKLTNVVAEESKEAETNLPASCCDAIFLRRVYHHLTKPAEFDASLVASLKPNGHLAIIDFPPRQGLDPVERVPANRGGHGIPEKVVIEELTAAGLKLEKVVHDWPNDSYCVLFVKKATD